MDHLGFPSTITDFQFSRRHDHVSLYKEICIWVSLIIFIYETWFIQGPLIMRFSRYSRDGVFYEFLFSKKWLGVKQLYEQIRIIRKAR